MEYSYTICHILAQLLSTDCLHWKTPIEVATGQRPKISAVMSFHWNKNVYDKHYKSTSANHSFPSESQQSLG
jgi:hypothetical protein